MISQPQQGGRHLAKQGGKPSQSTRLFQTRLDENSGQPQTRLDTASSPHGRLNQQPNNEESEDLERTVYASFIFEGPLFRRPGSNLGSIRNG